MGDAPEGYGVAGVPDFQVYKLLLTGEAAKSEKREARS